MTAPREIRHTDTADDADVMRSFDAVVSSWAEPVRCESAYGCRRSATWLALRHSPCGGHQPVCSVHHRKWVRAAVGRIARSGGMRCIYCGQNFKSIEACMRFQAL